MQLDAYKDILPEDHIPKEYVIGRKYHIVWAKQRGMVWILKGCGSDYASLETPKTRKPLLVKLKDLREINSFVVKNARKRLNIK